MLYNCLQFTTAKRQLHCKLWAVVTSSVIDRGSQIHLQWVRTIVGQKTERRVKRPEGSLICTVLAEIIPCTFFILLALTLSKLHSKLSINEILCHIGSKVSRVSRICRMANQNPIILRDPWRCWLSLIPIWFFLTLFLSKLICLFMNVGASENKVGSPATSQTDLNICRDVRMCLFVSGIKK